MFRILFGLVGVAVGSIAVAATYLFWPLPSAEMDWRELVEIHVANGNCVHYDSVFMFIPNSQLPEVVEYLEGTTIDARCANPYRERADGLTRQAIFDERVRRYEDQRQNAGPQAWLGLYQVWQHMSVTHDLRGSGVRSLLTYWPNLAIAARCEYRFNGEWYAWLLFRSLVTNITSPRHLELARLARAQECVAHINRQIASRPDDTEFVNAMRLVRMTYDIEVVTTSMRLDRLDQ